MTVSPGGGAPTPDAVVFRILGPLQVTGHAGQVRIPPGRQEVILAALLLEANRVVSTDYLVDLIWDDEPPDTARTQVQICVSRLRKLFSSAAIAAAITTRPPGYVLKTEGDLVDAALFARTVADARTLAKQGQLAGAAELLRAAAELWQGDCLSGVSSETLRSKALQLDEERLTATETRIELELDLGRHHQLVGEIQLLVRVHPLRERLRGQLMLALYRSGRQAEALESYRVGRELLVEELGLEPGGELRALESAILAGEVPPPSRPAAGGYGRAVEAAGTDAEPGAGAGPGPGPASEPGPGAGSAGAAAEPRRPAAAGEPSGAEPGRASAPPAPDGAAAYREEIPRQLPSDTSDFVGDEAQIARIERTLLGDGGQRAVGLAVVVGKPGTGKSTLATHIAHRLSETGFPDGQLYCDLRGTGSPATSAEVLGRFLRALGIPGAVIPESQDERAEMYRTLLASRRMLVVLDDAASESQIRPLLPGSRNCAVLVTSRVRLTGLPGAHRIELDVMSTEHALELLVRVIGADRVEREGAAAEALIRTVGGLPLALRIVAARLAARAHWTLASMVHRLANERHRLDELTHGEMTMRASLSLTHDGLAAPDRRLLRLLSLAKGPTLPGWLPGALLDDDRPFPSDLLEPLVDVQMLDVVGVESTGGFRYRFHEIIRVFAREQLAEHDEPAAQTAALGRMLGGWLSLAEQAHRRIYGGDFTVLHGSAPRWEPPPACVDELLVDPLEWLESEHANLVQAVEHAAEARMDELCWDLATTLTTLFEGRGYFDEWERTHRLALEAVRAAGNKRGTAALLSSLGVLHLGRSQKEESRTALTSALGLFRELDDRHGLALCHRDLALLERMRGNEEHALTLYDRALRDFDRVGDVVGRAIVLTQSAQIWMVRGQSSAAQDRLDEALGIYRSVGYTGGQARTLRRAGQLSQSRGEHERAVRTFSEVLELCRDSGDVIGEGHLLRDLGHAHAELGRGESARGFYAQALSVREQIMDQGGAAVVRLDLARLLLAGGNSRERSRSRELLESSVRVFRERRMDAELAEAERLLGSDPLPSRVIGPVLGQAFVPLMGSAPAAALGSASGPSVNPAPGSGAVRAPAAGSAAGV
ncbi:AfsR/SARP family transcriptional regulator [Streptomyces antarcticus]|uniref:AfsR/SARP family transcriptional regulator n=1 Tax=Streptomyces antarcticus TaxID=2996458 RepID=UPI00226D784D|nr:MULTISPECIES: BTAD domain-containing putative transcriptional regulator [unclassified Streptomyces]MCY0944325.1 BTAD domain-containing putative transcriptional regulator [Streptomyces sp. H34-AA3]MCZ4086630.1 BTAD domain-containing putative transcriptional regulator [Streptomyces sp. H34-S5]